ncbi:MAG: hypothetical protein HUU21_10035 [Polyangiaceae bacterium]|nr:hypothetical protein [Polyangiaceae bacterium]
MRNFLRTHWTRLAGGLMLAGVLSVAGVEAYQAYFGDCCAPGSPCCTPGAACCKNKHQVAQR